MLMSFSITFGGSKNFNKVKTGLKYACLAAQKNTCLIYTLTSNIRISVWS